jgi:hypothetical protein
MDRRHTAIQIRSVSILSVHIFSEARASCLRRRDAGGTPALRSGLAVALRLGARVSRPQSHTAGEPPALRSSSRRRDARSACPGCARLRCARGRAARAPCRFMGARASGARAGGEDAPAARRRAGTPAESALGARASGGIVLAPPGRQERPPWVRALSARISAAPALGARAFGAHISSACPGCARLRRAYQQRLPRVRAPPARISAAPAPGARASGAHGSSEDWRFRTVSQAPKG